MDEDRTVPASHCVEGVIWLHVGSHISTVAIENATLPTPMILLVPRIKLGMATIT
jgi:hypothetical protein